MELRRNKMKKSIKNLLLVIVLSLMANVPYSYAQSLETLDNISDFKLNSEIENSKDINSASSKSDLFSSEFNLSLGSQILGYQNVGKVFPSEAEHIDTGFKGFALSNNFTDSVKDNNNQNDLKSVITLNSSYEDNAIGFGDSSASSFSLSGRTGKLSLYGEYNKSNLTIGSGNQQSVSSSPVRASSMNSSEDGSNPSLISSDYYLEAVYSFKPTLKGKVAFKKTVMDTFDLKENVEVEGIVEATSDVSIKAGYSNENRPEVEKKSSKEQKVWTEFILKF